MENAERCTRIKQISSASLDRVLQRLKAIHRQAPRGVPPVIEYGLLYTSWQRTRRRTLASRESIAPRQFIAIKVAVKPGVPLASLLPTLSESARVRLRLAIFAYLDHWAEQDFVHGDLSPSNILVERFDAKNRAILWFIDWIFDLQSYEGTPLYASAEVYKGCHSAAADRYAVERIFGYN